MSQHAIYTTDIKIDVDTLVKAISRLADEIGFKIRDYVTDYYGNRTYVPIALYSPSLPRGIGFNVRDGKFAIEGDPYNYYYIFDKYSSLAKNYINCYLSRKQVYKLYPGAKVKTRIRETVVEMEVVL